MINKTPLTKSSTVFVLTNSQRPGVGPRQRPHGHLRLPLCQCSRRPRSSWAGLHGPAGTACRLPPPPAPPAPHQAPRGAGRLLPTPNHLARAAAPELTPPKGPGVPRSCCSRRWLPLPRPELCPSALASHSLLLQRYNICLYRTCRSPGDPEKNTAHCHRKLSAAAQ